jgi:hypothetical protein
MVVSSDYYLDFYLPDGTPNNHSLVRAALSHGRFI